MNLVELELDETLADFEVQDWIDNVFSVQYPDVKARIKKGCSGHCHKKDEWHYVKEGCKYPENGESVLVTVLDDDNEKIVTMALFEVENNKRFWDIESRLCSIHSGSEEVCSKIIAWAKVLPAGGEK